MPRPKAKFKTVEKEPSVPHVTFSIRVPKEHREQLKRIGKVYGKTRNMIITEMLDWAIKDQLKEIEEVQ